MGRRVVLHLLAGSKVILAHRLLRRLSNPVPAAEGRQRRVGKSGSFRCKFLMDPDQIPIAGGKQFQDPLAVWFRQL